MLLAGKVALVTGGGRRVGKAIAHALARGGARVAVHYNESAAGADDLVAIIRNDGGDAAAFQADLRDTSTHAPLIAGVVERFGTLDVLVNSAAIMESTPLDTVSVADWERTMDINLRAPFFLTLAAARQMRDNGGVVVNIGDLAAFETWRDYVVHGISKAGVEAMTKSFATMLAPAIRVNSVAPGAVLLPDGWPESEERAIAASTPLKRIGLPEDVAEAVLYLIAADYVTGVTIRVDGGRSIRR